MKKFAFIGAGSLQFTSSCIRDLLTFPAFKECEFALMDTNEENLRNIESVVKKIIINMDCPNCKIVTTTDRKVKVNKGDVFFIKAGTVHAIGRGIVICEVQQNSNTTYRVYDYNRTDKDGNRRPLHIEQAIAVAETKVAENYKRVGNVLAKCKYFTVEELEVEKTAKIEVTDETFKSIIVVDGNAELSLRDYRTNITKGDSLFIPAQNETFEIKGKCKLIISYI